VGSDFGGEIGKVDDAMFVNFYGLVVAGFFGGLGDSGMFDSGYQNTISLLTRAELVKGEVDGFGGAGGDDEVGAASADGVGYGILGGFVGVADSLGGEVGGGRVEKMVRKI